MARTQARMLTRVWNDDDFKALPRQVQGTYWFLISQANLTHAGVLPLTVKRWAQTAGGCTVEEVESDLKALEVAQYVVIDRETEELLIRTLVRNDGVWKQPKVMQAMKSDAAEIVSPLIRWRLREELLRIDVSGLEKQETRDTVSALIEQTVTALPETPPEGFAIPLETPTAYPHAGARARSSASTTTSASTPATGLALRAEPIEDPTAQLLAEHVRAYAEPYPLAAQAKVKVEIMRLLAERIPPDRIRAGLARLREKRLAASLLPQLVTEVSNTRSTTDQRVGDGLALAAELAAEGR